MRRDLVRSAWRAVKRAGSGGERAAGKERVGGGGDACRRACTLFVRFARAGGWWARGREQVTKETLREESVDYCKLSLDRVSSA